jgi:hypothetical protein
MRPCRSIGLPLVPLLFLAACAEMDDPGDTRIDITFDPCEPLVLEPAADATDEERASIARAIAMWNALIGGRLTMDEVPGARRLPVSFEEAPGSFYGVYEDEQGAILVNRRLEDDRERSITIAHELGHAFGMFHVDRDEATSVMNTANLTVAPQPFDADAIAALWGACATP